MKTGKQFSINRDEIKKLQAKSSPTLRQLAVALEKILYQPITDDGIGSWICTGNRL